MSTTAKIAGGVVILGFAGALAWFMSTREPEEVAMPEAPPPPALDQPASGPPASDPEPVTPTVNPAGEPVQAVQPASIDWDAALADIAAQREEAGDSGLAQVAAAGDPAPVPVLLPSGIVAPQNARPPRYKALEDGYYATFQGIDYDIVVNGTVSTFRTSEGAPPPERPDYVFTATDSGAQVALSRYGADYLVEFECNIIEENNTCITEEEALEVAENLIVTGGR